jgi:hypothetical protein
MLGISEWPGNAPTPKTVKSKKYHQFYYNSRKEEGKIPNARTADKD